MTTASTKPIKLAFALLSLLVFSACESGAAITSTDTSETSGTSVGDGTDSAEIWAEAWCRAGETCNCTGYSEASCLIAMAAFFNQIRESAETQSLIFSETCFDQWLTVLDASECLPPETFFPSCDNENSPPCQLFVGEQAIGDACEHVYAGNDSCAEGLSCGESLTCQDTCVDLPPPDEVGPGEPCGPNQGICPDDHYCSGICVAQGGAGAPCDFGYQCISGLYCTDNKVCMPAHAVGEPCTSTAQCHFSRCAAGICVDDAVQCYYLESYLAL